MKNINEINDKINEMNEEIRMKKIEIEECLQYQRDIGERLNRNCDTIKSREYRITMLESQKSILNWVKDSYDSI